MLVFESDDPFKKYTRKIMSKRRFGSFAISSVEGAGPVERRDTVSLLQLVMEEEKEQNSGLIWRNKTRGVNVEVCQKSFENVHKTFANGLETADDHHRVSETANDNYSFRPTPTLSQSPSVIIITIHRAR